MSQPVLMLDPYRALGEAMPLEPRLEHMYRVLREHYDGIQRFAVALYDAKTETVSSFMYASDETTALADYCLPLQQVPSLLELAETSSVRVVADMRVFRNDEVLSAHSQALLAEGLRSSLTLALRHEGALLGFLFLNSKRSDYFSPDIAAYCSLWAHLVEQVLAESLVKPDVV